MAFILGIYSRHQPLHLDEYREAIDTFSSFAPGKVQQIKREKFFMAGDNLWLQSPCVENDDENCVAVSGHFYNWQEVTPGAKSLANGIKEGYVNGGTGFLKKLTGSFAIAAYNEATHSLKLVNDCSGFYPLFYYLDKDVCIFCTAIEPVTSYKKFDDTWDFTALAQYTKAVSVFDDRTLFKHIKNLNPGSEVTISSEAKS